MKRIVRTQGMCGLLFALVIGTLPARVASQSVGDAGKPVRLVVSVTAGGGTDTLARTLAPKLSERWGQPVVVENRAGAAGYIAMENIAASAADGQSLALFNASHLLLGRTTKLSFERNRDFTPIALPGSTEFVLIVYPGLGVKTFKDFVALAKSKPGVLNYISSGVGSIPHLTTELLAYKAGINMVPIAYQGVGGATLPDLLAGRTQVYLVSPTSAAPHVKSGGVIALAITGNQRSPILPDVATFDEVGLHGYDVSSWWVVFGPGKMAPALVSRLNADFNAVTQQRDISSKLVAAGLKVHGTQSAAEVDDYIAREIIKWNDAMKLSGVR